MPWTTGSPYPHSAALCLCGHAMHAHRDWSRRRPPEHCHVGNGDTACPCSGFNALDTHPVPAGNLSEVLVGLTVTFETVLGTVTGLVTDVTITDGAVDVVLELPGEALRTQHLMLNPDILVSITFHTADDWDDQ